MRNRNKIVQCISNAEYVRADTYHPQNNSSCLIICRFDNFIVEAVSGYSDGEFDWVRNLPKDHDGKVLLWAYTPEKDSGRNGRTSYDCAVELIV